MNIEKRASETWPDVGTMDLRREDRGHLIVQHERRIQKRLAARYRELRRHPIVKPRMVQRQRAEELLLMELPTRHWPTGDALTGAIDAMLAYGAEREAAVNVQRVGNLDGGAAPEKATQEGYGGEATTTSTSTNAGSTPAPSALSDADVLERAAKLLDSEDLDATDLRTLAAKLRVLSAARFAGYARQVADAIEVRK